MITITKKKYYLYIFLCVEKKIILKIGQIAIFYYVESGRKCKKYTKKKKTDWLRSE